MKKGILRGYNFKREDDLEKIVLEIIAYYQPIITADIWYELGEDERFEGVISRLEVDEALSQLEGQELIKKGKDEKWRINKPRQHLHCFTINHSDH